MEIIVDWPRIEAVLGAIMERFEANGYPYSLPEVVTPQDHRHMPKSLELGSQQHAIFLFCLCYYMRGGTGSVTSAKCMSRMYDALVGTEIDPFDLTKAAALPPQTITAQLRRFSLGFQSEEIGRFWVENAKRLLAVWEGDPRRIFENVDNYEESLERVCNHKKGGGFLGFKKKMTSMILYYLMDEKLIDFFLFPIPVDFHVTRIFISNELAYPAEIPENGNCLSEDFLDTLRVISMKYCIEHDIDPLRLCDALWLLSGSLCELSPGNKSIYGKYDARRTTVTPVEVIWSRTQLERHFQGCYQCPVQSTCNWNVPSGPWYRWGQAVRLRPREEPNILFHAIHLVTPKVRTSPLPSTSRQLVPAPVEPPPSLF